MRSRLFAILSLCALTAIALVASARAGGGFTVNSTLDEPDASAGDGNCVSTASGFCTLRAAIMEANALTGTDTINLPTGTYTLTRPGNDDTSLNGDLDITASVVINGAGSATTSVAASGMYRVMHVTSASASVTISGLTLRNGAVPADPPLDSVGGGFLNVGLTTLNDVKIQDSSAAGGGGGVGNAGVLTLTNSTVQSNTTPFSGGGIANTGALTLTHSFVLSNTSTDDGGGISTGNLSAATATVTIFNSTIGGNASGDDGGGVRNISFGVVTILSSTITANSGATYGGGLSNKGIAMLVTDSAVYSNTAGDDGGGIYNETGALTVTNSTLSGNTSDADGGGLYNFGATVNLNNVTIAYNIADGDANGTGEGGGLANGASVTVTLQNTLIGQNSDNSPAMQRPDCSGTLLSQDYNLVQSTTGCTITGAVASNIYGQDPLLMPLDDYGGPTLTHDMNPLSPALDAGNILGCTDAWGFLITSDQRGFPRPSGPRCEIGAVERDVTLPTLTPTLTQTPTHTLTPTITDTPLTTDTPTPTPIVTDTATPTPPASMTPTATATIPPIIYKLYWPILRR